MMIGEVVHGRQLRDQRPSFRCRRLSPFVIFFGRLRPERGRWIPEATWGRGSGGGGPTPYR